MSKVLKEEIFDNMKSKEEIVEILMHKLGYIYCYNCKIDELRKNGEKTNCDECHKGNMRWEISYSYAEEIANIILEP